MIKTATFNLEKYRICDEIKNLRNELNLTQKEFGKIFNIPQNNISMWENYKSAPPNYIISMMQIIIELKTKGSQISIFDKIYYKSYVRYKMDERDLHSRNFESLEKSQDWQNHIKGMAEQLTKAYILKIKETIVEKIDVL